MSQVDGAYFIPESAGLRPVPEARSPWAEDMLHGRLLGGLAAWAAESSNDDPTMRLVRLTVDMFRFPPMAPIETSTHLTRAGGRVRALQVSITHGETEIARAHALFLKVGEQPAGKVWSPPEWDAPSPESVPPPDVDGGGPGGGWEIRMTSEGGFWSAERKQVWTRDSWHLVAGEPLSPAVRAALAADMPNPLANSGDQGLGFINPDLTLFLARPPVSEWIGLEVSDHVSADGIAIGSCALYDTAGRIGSSTVTGVANKLTLAPE